MSETVAIIGRPNVGKSTLFNRLTKSKDAIVDPTSGVTRDRHEGSVDWNGHDFLLFDTGGYITDSGDAFEKAIRQQIMVAVQEADIIIFMTDILVGVTDLDEQIAKIIRKSGKPTILVVNKADNTSRLPEANFFYSLGFKELYPVSSINGSGTGELLDQVTSLIKSTKTEEIDLDKARFAIVGRPNVGKSTLLNSLLGTERSIVTPVAGTTRDSIHTNYNKYGHDVVLIDTAGLRKKVQVKENIEFYSVMRSIRSIEQSDVCFLMIDAKEGIQAQDMAILKLALDRMKGLVILVNKWDAVEKDHRSSEEYLEKILEKTAPFTNVPVLFISAISKQRIIEVLKVGMKVFESRKRKIPTATLNNILLPLISNNPPPMVKGKRVKVKYITQLPTHAPGFALFCNLPQYVKEPYKRFVENTIRRNFDLEGVPMKVFMRKK